jgi:hypothetical protein
MYKICDNKLEIPTEYLEEQRCVEQGRMHTTFARKMNKKFSKNDDWKAFCNWCAMNQHKKIRDIKASSLIPRLEYIWSKKHPRIVLNTDDWYVEIK